MARSPLSWGAAGCAAADAAQVHLGFAFADCWLLVSPTILHIHCQADGCRGSRCKWFVLCCRAQGRARRIHSLAVHPAQPHLAASGASDGGLAIWDLRFDAGSPPQQAALDQSHVGAVLKVRFRVSLKRDSLPD